jgi:ABC-type multidrug transport system fused ATPase/permease subunit
MRNNKALPLKSLTLLGNSADSVGWRVDRLIYELKELGGFNKTLRTLYEAIEIVNQIKDGDISYPGPTSTELGMKVEFKCVCRLLLCRHMRRIISFLRSVSFTYPKKEGPALQGMSFAIQAGQLCVIVGENGCGKVRHSGLTAKVRLTSLCCHPEQHSESPRKTV